MRELDDDRNEALIKRALADSLADYTPPANGELHLPVFDEVDNELTLDRVTTAAEKSEAAAVSDSVPMQTALPMDTPVPPVQDSFDGWSTSYDRVDSGHDSGIKAEPDDYRLRASTTADVDASFDITRVFSATGSTLQRQTKEWGSATVAVFAARKEQHNLVWIGIAALVAIIALAWLFKPGDAPVVQEQTISLDPVSQTVPVAAPVQSASVNVPPPVVGEMPVASSSIQNTAPAQVQANSSPATSSATVQAADKTVKTATVYQPAKSETKPVSKPVASAAVAKGGFTVQIAAAHNEANIKSLAAKLPKPAQAQIVRTWRDGKPWYVLYYGNFKRHEDAASARDALPAAVKKGNSPWVKAL